ncbi:bifunctional phosphopantothenoylcysteine decarboxylase/phosphopantothenate--cysteine ligase CoaBC [bacterium]|nr:bifunctional phosphopantothenoylcysteine decarboxylase/phosphopantothenate--cysteine ligase CoaBC [bacterium]
MKKKSFLITAGPTREFIDKVRFLSNPSTGKMGFSLAEEIRARGYDVLLVKGVVTLPVPSGVKAVDVVSAEQMKDAVITNIEKYSALIMCAAVCDYQPVDYISGKIKKSDSALTIRCKRTPDILAHVMKEGYKGFKIGFAAECKNLAHYAKDKLQRKNLNIIIANDISKPDRGFAADTNAVSIFTDKGNRVDLPLMPKRELASKIVDFILDYIGCNSGCSQ